jgi:nucleoside-diphosphate-sugar epimerase
VKTPAQLEASERKTIMSTQHRTPPLLLLTGATGKVGQTLMRRLTADSRFEDWSIRAFCHNRVVEETDRVSVFRGDTSRREDVRAALDGVTHVVHLATSKETPSTIMDVAIKGLFWLLEEARVSGTFERFVLIGGDAGVGHFFYPHPIPVTEEQRHTAYPGCYALSKVLEEVMLEQYYVQYDFSGVCLRAPWIMEKDDFRYSLRFDDEQFGGPRIGELVGPEKAQQYQAEGRVPVLCDENGEPLLRNFVHVEDLVSAILIGLRHPQAHQSTFNICMDEPVNYRHVAEHLAHTRSLPSVDIPTGFHSTWLDNTKAKFRLGWRPEYDTERLIEEAWQYQRGPDEPRVIYYPG